MSYSAFRADFIEAASSHGYNVELLKKLGTLLDSVAVKYDFAVKCTDMVVYNQGLPPEAKQYLVSCKIEGQSNGTVKNKKLQLELFAKTVTKPLRDVTANDVRVYLYGYKEGRGVSDQTLDKVRQYLNAFFEWCVENDMLTKNVMRQIKPIKCDKRQRTALTQLELEIYRQACQTDRERAVLEFLYSAGCRCAELCAVKQADIDWDNNRVRLFGKGRKERFSYMTAKCALLLKTYLANRGFMSDYVFANDRLPHGKPSNASVERLIHDLENRVGDKVQKHVSPHILRHTTATQALRAGMPIVQIQKLLGHANVATTQIYAETNQEEVAISHSKYVV